MYLGRRCVRGGYRRLVVPGYVWFVGIVTYSVMKHKMLHRLLMVLIRVDIIRLRCRVSCPYVGVLVVVIALVRVRLRLVSLAGMLCLTVVSMRLLNGMVWLLRRWGVPLACDVSLLFTISNVLKLWGLVALSFMVIVSCFCKSYWLMVIGSLMVGLLLTAWLKLLSD